jgi:pimeloyl-ACP methyl ester carboxylesterase
MPISPAVEDGKTQQPWKPAAYTERTIEVAGLKLHCLDYGAEGLQPMLCVHGSGAHAHWFDFVAPGLAQHFHVIALDQRGHGDSDWPEPPDYSYDRFARDLDEVVRKLDLRDFVLLGHSMGGTVSLTYTGAHPERVAALIVVDTVPRMAADRLEAIRQIGQRKSSGYATLDDLVARYRLRPDSGTTPAHAVRYIAERSGRRSEDGRWRHKFDRRQYATRKFVDTLALWSHITVPALLVKGEHSTRITAETYPAVKERCPHVVLAEVPGSDHHVTLDNPEGLVRAVRQFLGKP